MTLIQNESFLWAEARFYSIVLGIAMIFFAILIYTLPSAQTPEILLVKYLFSIVFLAMAFPLLFAKPVKITDAGIFTGNKYLVSEDVPSQWALSANVLLWPFKKEQLIRWTEIRKANVTEMAFSVWLNRVAGWQKLTQEYFRIETDAGEKIWIGLSQASVKHKRVSLRELLKERTKSV